MPKGISLMEKRRVLLTIALAVPQSPARMRWQLPSRLPALVIQRWRSLGGGDSFHAMHPEEHLDMLSPCHTLELLPTAPTLSTGTLVYLKRPSRSMACHSALARLVTATFLKCPIPQHSKGHATTHVCSQVSSA